MEAEVLEIIQNLSRLDCSLIIESASLKDKDYQGLEAKRAKVKELYLGGTVSETTISLYAQGD